MLFAPPRSRKASGRRALRATAKKKTPTGDRHLMLVRLGVAGFIVAIGGGVVGVVGVMGVSGSAWAVSGCSCAAVVGVGVIGFSVVVGC